MCVPVLRGSGSGTGDRLRLARLCGERAAHGTAPAASQSLAKIHWTMPVDLAPPLRPGGGELLIHYASPMITPKNTVLVPVKTTSQGSFEIAAVAGTTGPASGR